MNKFTNLRNFTNSYKYYSTKPFKLQYVSDLHIDTHKYMPIIKPLSKYIAICGDIAQPYATNYKKFIQEQSRKFEKVFIVPGNHDFDLGVMYRRDYANKWEPVIKNICSDYKNVYYLNCNTHQLDDNILIAGSILWSRPTFTKYQINSQRFSKNLNHIIEHQIEHQKHVDWISNTIEDNKDKKIIILTHFVPTFKLIEKKYLNNGSKQNTWFATDLEYLIKNPVKAWICGHTHSVMTCDVNNVQCAVNAYGNGATYHYEQYFDKVIEI